LNKNRKLILSVGIADCIVQTFTVGGPGGGGKDTSNTGVRIIHSPSNASGRATETRSQTTNKQRAFQRMASSPEFISWCKREAARLQGKPSIEERVEASLTEDKLKIEYRTENGWEEQ
jgi:protein subunit release factor B